MRQKNTQISAFDKSVLKACTSIARSESSEDVVKAFTDLVEPFGVTGLMIGHIVDTEVSIANKTLRISTWPTEFLAARADHRPATHDPVINYAIKTLRPFYWKQAFEYASRYGREIADTASEYGLRDGMMFPIVDLERMPGGVSIAGERLTVTSDHARSISLAASHAFFKLEELTGPYHFEVRAKLSNLETDALYFAAHGKTSWEISKILSISETSAKAAIVRARKKLDASSLAHATAIAMRQRIIV